MAVLRLRELARVVPGKRAILESCSWPVNDLACLPTTAF